MCDESGHTKFSFFRILSTRRYSPWLSPCSVYLLRQAQAHLCFTLITIFARLQHSLPHSLPESLSRRSPELVPYIYKDG